MQEDLYGEANNGIHYVETSPRNNYGQVEKEEKLIRIAENDPNNEKANLAMKELRKKYDSTYIWCEDCDGLVVKEKDCCLNNIKN